MFYVRRFLCLCSEPPWNKVQADGWTLLQAITMKMIVERANKSQVERTTITKDN